MPLTRTADGFYVFIYFVLSPAFFLTMYIRRAIYLMDDLMSNFLPCLSL